MLTTITALGAGTAQALAHGPMGYGWGGPWFLLFPLFWLIVIGLFIFFGRRNWRRHNMWHQNQGAESVLRERYARGEIDETEYRARLEVLRADHTK
ncbi:SHOCT domain-containing protein [Arthrobacter sp. 35W]|uniref:SHOCT domain-containing protein n=1 Tax=Arthrobacter sp. 35W TaxID=1132441 RepID=UPI00040981D8|nr:SHOCT domain-containing protein [Arthrobacter sp. 35W]